MASGETRGVVGSTPRSLRRHGYVVAPEMMIAAAVATLLAVGGRRMW